MRVIAGRYKGIKLNTLKGDMTRPTTDRIKETLFNILQFDVQGAVFADLFAGSGAIGIEALSREDREECPESGNQLLAFPLENQPGLTAAQPVIFRRCLPAAPAGTFSHVVVQTGPFLSDVSRKCPGAIRQQQSSGDGIDDFAAPVPASERAVIGRAVLLNP